MPERIGGWLRVYVVALAILLLHGLGLTVAAIIIYANPSIAGLHTFIPLASLLVYVVTNLVLAGYTVVLYVQMFKRRRSAIVNNLVFNTLSVVFVMAWLFLGEKSHLGTVIDVLPGLVGCCYFLMSRRVRNTFTRGGEGRVRATGDQRSGGAYREPA
jgi:drug/metabolite transporter (DMT)-like permease